MKQFRSCTMILSLNPDQSYLRSEECQIEQEVKDGENFSLYVVPMNPIYRSNSRRNKGVEITFLTIEELKAA